MPKFKQQITEEKAIRIAYSMQKLCILSQVMQYEHANELDVDFKMPIVNNFAKRIGTDAQAIIDHIKRHGKIIPTNHDAVEEYSAVIWQILDLIIGLKVEALQEFH